jgi:NDP-sugar pyrophosphorylase family protein
MAARNDREVASPIESDSAPLHELVLDMLSRDTRPHEYAFDGCWFDIGRPEDYDRANADFGMIRGSLLKEA